jgi:hypothetical protein
MTASLKLLCHVGILFGYAIFTYLVLLLHIDFGCLVSYICNTEDPSQWLYIIPGRVLVFLNLWALVFFVNVDFFRDGPRVGRALIWPLITSTIWTSIVFVSAAWIMTIGGFLIIGFFGLDVN